MKLSLALTAVFLPIIVNAQNNIDVRCAFINPSIFIDIPQVAVGPGGALTYSPSNFTASNGTTVTFIFPSYNFPYVLDLQWCSHVSPTGANIPSRNLRSQPPARIWRRPTARLAVSIPAYRPRSSSPSRSQMIKSVSQRFCHLHRNRHFFFVLILTTAIWFFCKEDKHCGLGMVG